MTTLSKTKLCVKAMNGLASSGLITMDEASCIESTEAGRLMSVFYLDLETMKHIMKINGTESLESLLWIICESHELADMHLRVDERRCLNMLNRNNAAATIRFPMKGKITTRQMKLNCIIQAILGCLNIPDPSLNQEAMKIIRIADRVCKCLVAYVTRTALISQQPKYHSAVLNALILAKCVAAHLWESSPYVSKQLKGIGPTFSTLLATAGKVNFMLLEESHPRDLERIMNKGPPAGNVLRKQVSLLPKYQLTMTPIDEKSVTIQLVLLNQNHLSENMEQLTAGDTHKGYLVVGDSENNLLLLTSFKDKDLIGVYDGVIAHQITRKHSFEHKLFVHCVSSNFVGIDAQCEYLFKNLEAVYHSHKTTSENVIIKPATKQTNITDTFKERKRKNASEDITQSKEKKKRDNALLEKLKTLKESFGKTTRELKKDMDKSDMISRKILQDYTHLEKPVITTETVSLQPTIIEPPIINCCDLPIADATNISSTEQIYSDETSAMDDEKINDILIEIENEILRYNKELPPGEHGVSKNIHMQSSSIAGSSSMNIHARSNVFDNKPNKALNNTKKKSQKNNRSNYNFIDLLNKNINLSDEEDELVSNEISGFSDTIKSQVEKYLQHTKNISSVPDKSIAELLVDSDENCKRGKVYDGYSKIEPEINNVNVNISGDKMDDETNELQCKVDMDFVEASQDTIKEEKTVNKTEDETIKRLLQRVILEPDQTTEVMNNNHIEISNRCLDLETNIIEKSPQVKNSSAVNNHIRFDDNYQHQNNFLIPVVYDDAVSEKNQAKNTSAHLVTYSDNSCQGNRKAPNALEISSSLLRLPIPYHYEKRPEKLETQRKNIFQTNIMMLTNRTGMTVKRNQPDTLSENIHDYNNDAPPQPNIYKEDANIRKYSYSATKVDVAKANHVTVIRKIKMDVDITEINDGQDISQDIHNYRKNEKHNSVYNPEIKNKDFEALELYFDEGENNKRAVNVCNRQHDIKDNIKYEEQNCMNNMEVERTEFEMLESHKEAKENKTALIVYNHTDSVCEQVTKFAKKNIQDTFVDQNNEGHCLSPKLNTPPSKCNFQCKQTAHKTSNYNTEADKSDNLSSQKESNRLGSILQKYSMLLRKENAGNFSQTPTQPKVINSSCNKLSEKPKKPFKITEIQHLKTSLSKLQLSETAKCESIDQIINATHNRANTLRTQLYKEQNKEFTYTQEDLPDENILSPPESKETWQNSSQNIAYTETIADSIEEELCKFELEDAAIEEVEACSKTNFNIDQCMFNPQTLLQCFKNDESNLVVPPPPEFCDEETELIPQGYDVAVPMDCYEPMRWDNSYGDNPIESSFQDEPNMVLTPRKEIETWMLSQNNESNQNLATPASFNSKQCFTIMHTPRQRSSFHNVSVSRQNKLGQFKYSRKKKLVP